MERFYEATSCADVFSGTKVLWGMILHLISANGNKKKKKIISSFILNTILRLKGIGKFSSN